MDNTFFTNHLSNRSELTRKTYHRSLTRFEIWLSQREGSLSALTRIDVQEYVTYRYRTKNCKPTTVHKDFAAIASYAVYTGQGDSCESIRLPQVSAPEAPKALSRNERNDVLRQVERDGNLRDIAVIYLLYELGLRASELVHLDRSDVTLHYHTSESYVHIRYGKGYKERTIPFPEQSDAKHWLSKYLESRTDEHPALFLSNYRRRLSQRSLNRLVGKYGIHPHLLRHTMLTELARSGADLFLISRLAGHSHLETTKRYTMPTLEEQARAMTDARLNR